MSLELADVVSGYGHMEIVRHVSLAIPTDGLVVVIGPNGAGKSTLLKTIFGFIRPMNGTIVLDGKDLTRYEPHELLKLGLLYVQQGRSIFPRLTIEENLAMNVYSIRDRSAVREAFDRAYVMFPMLQDQRRRAAGTLSGGQRRLLELARIVMLRPRLVLLDEPSIGCAPRTVAEIYGKIRSLHEDGVGFLIVEQNVRLALSAADRACVLEAGQVRWWGPPAGIEADDALRELYLGAAARTGARTQ
jgi:ABC-type branched-subunit amino acid transport system ATPase component